MHKHDSNGVVIENTQTVPYLEVFSTFLGLKLSVFVVR